MAQTVQRWTGRETRALREAMRLSVRSFAGFLGISDRAISKWEANGGARVPGPESQAILDTAFQQSDEGVRARFWDALGLADSVQEESSDGFAMLPRLEPSVIQRKELLTELEHLVLAMAAEAGPRIVTLVGPGGFGKTTLAALLGNAESIRDTFPEILWVEAGEDCTAARTTQLISDLCFHLDGSRPELADAEQAGFHLARVIGDRRLLLVVDNVWSGADLAPFLLGGPNCIRVVTTRNLRVAPASARTLRVGPMASVEIAEMLQRTVPEATTDALRPVAELCGGWPLLANLVGASVGTDVMAGAPAELAVGMATGALRTEGPQAFDVWDSDQRKVTIRHVITETLKGLDEHVHLPGAEGLSDRYMSLAIFPPATPIPVDVIGRWWRNAHGWTDVAVRHFCRVLADRSLISAYRPATGTIVLHDVFRAYLRSLVMDDLVDLHGSLLAALRPDDGWNALETDRRYEWTHLAYHLAGAEELETLGQMVSRPAYVIGKATVCGAHSLRSDRDIISRARAKQPPPEVDTLLAEALDLTAHGYLLHGQSTSEEMSATLQVAMLRQGRAGGDAADGVRASTVKIDWTLVADDVEEPGHVGTIVSVAARGSLVVSGGEDGVVRLWDLSSRRMVLALRGHTGWVHAVAISPDGSMIATAGEDNAIRLWSTEDGSQLGVLKGHDKRIRSLVFRQVAAELVSGAEDGLVKFWDLNSFGLSRQASTRGVGIWSIAVSPDDRHVAASGEDEYVRLFDAQHCDLLDEKAYHRSWVRGVCFSDDNKLVSASADGTARVWDVRMNALEPADVLDAGGERLRAVALHDGEIVTAGEDATVIVHRADRASVRMPKAVNWVRSVASTSEGVVAACEDGGLRLWEPGLDEVETIAAGRNTIWSAAFDLEKNVVLGRADGTITYNDSTTGQVVARLEAGHGRVWAVASSGPFVAAACGDGLLRVWQDQSLILELNQDVTLTWAVAITADGDRMVASDTNGHVRAWSLPSGEILWDHDAQAGRVRSLALTGMSDLAAAAGGDGIVRIWKLSTGDERGIVEVPGWARTVAFDDAGSRLAVGAGTGDIYMYPLNDSSRPIPFLGHRGRVLMLGFDEGSDALVSAAADGTVRRWRIEDQVGFQVRVDASGQCAAFDGKNGGVAIAGPTGATLLHLTNIHSEGAGR